LTVNPRIALGKSPSLTASARRVWMFTYTWQYSATTGLLNTLTYPVGASGQSLELQYGYQNGILQSITDVRDSPNVTVWQADAENPAGQITQETLGNGLETNRAYDGVTGWLSSVQSGPGGGASIQNLSFLYDEVGNVTQRQDGIHNLSEDIYYDSDYRLSYTTLGGTQNLSMGYDAMGDITKKSTVSNNASWTYDSVHLHQLREAGSTSYEYTYDANGNMTSWAGEPITWSSYNYPTKITGGSDSFTYSYAPDRSVWLEVQTGGAGASTYRLGSPLMSIVVGGSGTTDRNYIYAGNEPVAIDERTSAGNTFYYLLTDHQGSISGITNSSGQVVVNESFHPDGQRRNPSTWTDPVSTSDVNTIQGISARGYTFKETLEYMNLVNFGGRVGDVYTGRFLSADPNITDESDPQSYNRYSYTVNNPLTYTDPTGFLYTEECWDDDCESGGELFGDPGNYAPPSPSNSGGSDGSGGSEGDGGNGGSGSGGSSNGGSSNGGAGPLPEGWQDLNTTWQTCIGDQCESQDDDLQQSDPDQSDPTLPQLQQVTVSGTSENDTSVSDEATGGSPETADTLSTLNEIVVQGYRARSFGGVKIDFSIPYPEEQLWAVYGNSRIIYLGSNNGTAKGNTGENRVRIPGGFIAIVHTHPSWAEYEPGPEDYGQSFPLYGMAPDGVWLILPGSKSPIVLYGAPIE